MNPDNNNPFSSAGTGTTSNTYGQTSGNYGSSNSMSGMASDSLTSAADTLSAAAGLSPNGVSAPGYNQYGATDTSSTPQLSVSEGPLTPAAPVPGSIGSVTSVPPVAVPESSAMPTFAPAGSTTGSYNDVNATSPTMNSGAANTSASNLFAPAAGTTGAANAASSAATPAGPTAAASATITPAQHYNPFAKDAAKTPAAGTPTSTAIPSTQPSMSKPKNSPGLDGGHNGKQPTKLMIILGIALAITTISTIVFIILYIQALNSPKTIQVPPMTNTNNVTTSSVKNLTCVQETNNSENGATVNELVAKYLDGDLDTITMTTTDNYGSIEAAQAAQDAFISSREARLNIAGISEEPFTVSYDIEPSGDISVLTYSISAKANQLNASNADSAFGGFTTIDGEVDTALDSIRTNYESVGFVCEES